MTRVEAQRHVNELYVRKEIDQQEWSRRFDELSSPRWTAEGPAVVNKKKPNDDPKKQ